MLTVAQSTKLVNLRYPAMTPTAVVVRTTQQLEPPLMTLGFTISMTQVLRTVQVLAALTAILVATLALVSAVLVIN